MKKYIVLAFLFFIFIAVRAQSYEIKVKIKGLSQNDTLLLAHRFADKNFLDDTTTVGKNGIAVFKGDKKLDGGIYLVLIPSKNNIFFEFLLEDEQKFTLETDTADLLANLKAIGSPLNRDFFEFQKGWGDLQKQAFKIQEEAKELKEDDPRLAEIRKDFENIDIKRKEYLRKTWEKNPKSLLGKIVLAMTPLEIPEFDLPEDTPQRDSLIRLYKYVYNKDHFFDHIDFSDDNLLRTPLIEARLKEFLTRVVMMDPDSLTKEAFRVCDLASVNKDVFRYVVVYTTNHFETSSYMGMDRIFVNLAERYYLTGKAWWADSTLIDKITERVTRLKPTLIGNVAPDLRMETNDGRVVRLHEINADFTVVVFYEPSCGHCKKVLPKLYEYYTKPKDQRVEVFAVYTQGDQKEWFDFIDKYHFDWFNVWDPYHFSNFRVLYDIISTPIVLVLDKDKKVIGKKLSVEQIEQLIGHYSKK